MAGEQFTLFLRHAVLTSTSRPEITSAHPTCGGPYFWAAMLAKPHQAPFASWITGWFNFLGQVAITMGIRFVFLF
jgi:hypothetical protein